MPPQTSNLTFTTTSSKSKNISSSGLIYSGRGVVVGVVINSHSSGTLLLSDSLTTNTPIIFNTISFAVGEHYINLFGATFNTGLYATIGGTADLTVCYN